MSRPRQNGKLNDLVSAYLLEVPPATRQHPVPAKQGFIRKRFGE
jgi:hypothetical protein